MEGKWWKIEKKWWKIEKNGKKVENGNEMGIKWGKNHGNRKKWEGKRKNRKKK